MTIPTTAMFRDFAAGVVARNVGHLLDYSEQEQIDHAVAALERFERHAHIKPAPSGLMIDLAGFGSAPVHFIGGKSQYLLISEVAEALGTPVWEACEWADREHLWALYDQRQKDEESGILGWECLGGYCDLRLSFVADNPEAKPDGGGRRTSTYGDWLISQDRLLAIIADSPWGKVFMSNARDLMRLGMRKVMGDGPMGQAPVYRPDGNPAIHDDGTPMTAADIWHTPLTEEEARLKARRGPNIPIDEMEGDQ
ncbi:hypothetical protein ACIBI9_04090 [Nonomuraea sp. NPDC050451]|uniref:hypothetical protein n=1 Tax=Nonomuraea sp. NPDC050451 TaxID=3364364 RepID=UPI0037AE2AFD